MFYQLKEQMSVVRQPEGHFGMCFGTQESTLVYVLQQGEHCGKYFSTILHTTALIIL